MLNRVTVTIDEIEYTVVAEENEEYIRKNAALVDQNIREIKDSTPFSTLTATVLAAMNIADKYYKAQDLCDDLRTQIRDYADECSKLKAELYRLRKK